MSPRGFEGVRQASQDIETRRQSGGNGSRVVFFKLPKDGDSARVRFLEQGDDIEWAWKHQLPATGNQKWGDWVPCLDQKNEGVPCPGCARQLPRKFKGYINLIHRNAPDYKRNAEGRLEKDSNNNLIQIGNRDQVAVWEQGINIFEELDGMDVQYKGLTTRDFVITRKGTELNTRYTILPLDKEDDGQLSEADKKLAESKFDVRELTTPTTEEEFMSRLTGQPAQTGGGSDSVVDEDAGKVNPFINRRD